MGRRIRPIAMAVLVVACALAGCESAATDRAAVVRAHGTPVVADALSPPRTALGDGFSVPRGAQLVGAVLPDDPATGYPNLEWTRAWTALLLVGGDPGTVMDAFLAQAVEQGMAPFSTLTCVDNECSSGATVPSRPVGSLDVVRSLSLSLSPRASLLEVRYRERSDTNVEPRAAVRNPVELHRVTPGAVMLPRVGSRLDLDLGSASIRVQPGSRPLAPPYCDACFGGDLVVMRVEHGRRVLGRYARATKRLDAWEGNSWHHAARRESWTVTTRGFGNTDTSVVFELFEQPHGPDYLRLTLDNGA
jgi:hypothetical protein